MNYKEENLKTINKWFDKDLFNEIKENNDLTNFIEIYLDDNYENEDYPIYKLIQSYRFTELDNIPNEDLLKFINLI